MDCGRGYRLKAERKAAAKRAKEQKRKQKEANGGRVTSVSVAQRIQNKKQRAMEDAERGDDHDALLSDIKNAANDFHSRQQVG